VEECLTESDDNSVLSFSDWLRVDRFRGTFDTCFEDHSVLGTSRHLKKRLRTRTDTLSPRRFMDVGDMGQTIGGAEARDCLVGHAM